MKSRPILFSAPMVRAILAGKKTQTRRIYKPHGKYPYEDGEITPNPNESSKWVEWGGCPYGAYGDELWVRETWGKFDVKTGCGCRLAYQATDTKPDYEDAECCGSIRRPFKWRYSLYMPRWASRITLRITGVWVERLQEISEEDANAEGVELHGMTRYATEARDAYRMLWESINGKGSWAENPWVWVVQFEHLREGAKGGA